MRGPILNMSPGLGASGVDIEYRRNSQGTVLRLLSFLCATEINQGQTFDNFTSLNIFLFSHEPATSESRTNSTVAAVLQTA